VANVLAVDDSVSLRKLVVAALEHGGHHVVEAANGIDGMTLAKQQVFDLVISDVNMPGMDGITFLRQLRVLASYKGVPVLMLTTEMDAEKKREAKEAGATGWIIKPFDPTQLLSIIRKVVD
jgi:two-component system chemotaxis response regulator CheY